MLLTSLSKGPVISDSGATSSSLRSIGRELACNSDKKSPEGESKPEGKTSCSSSFFFNGSGSITTSSLNS